MMRTVSEAEMYFTSVERVSQFAELKIEPLSWDDKGLLIEIIKLMDGLIH